MGAPWARQLNTTIKNYIKGAEVQTLRNRKVLALLKKKGRITFDWSGNSMVWRIKFRRFKPTPFADGDTLEFSRKNRYQTAELDWRGYSATDSMTKGEYLANRGPQAIINEYSQIATDLMEDLDEDFSEQIYINGYLPQNAKRLHGVESCMAAVQNVGNGAATPTGSYAGLSCVPGALGGSWDSGALPSWPNGRGTTDYDAWSPIIVDYGDTLFSPTNTWLANCVEAISFAIIKAKKSKSTKGQLDVIMTDDELYRAYLSVLRTKERIEISRDGSKSPLVALGFSDVVNQDGTDITWEYGMPPGIGYGLNCDQIEIRSQQAQLFVPEGPEQDQASKSWRFSIDFFGNMVINPKFQIKLVKLT